MDRPFMLPAIILKMFLIFRVGYVPPSCVKVGKFLIIFIGFYAFLFCPFQYCFYFPGSQIWFGFFSLFVFMIQILKFVFMGVVVCCS